MRLRISRPFFSKIILSFAIFQSKMKTSMGYSWKEIYALNLHVIEDKHQIKA